MHKTTRYPLLDMGLILGLWEERRLRMFENRVLSKVLDPMSPQVTGYRIILHNEVLYEFYSPNTSYYSGDKIKYEIGMARTTRVEKCIQGFVAKM